jgi:hypothetical protein
MARLISAVVNSGFSRPEKPLDPKDLMSVDPYGENPEPRKPRGKRMTSKRRSEVADGIRSVMEQFMKKSASAT